MYWYMNIVVINNINTCVLYHWSLADRTNPPQRFLEDSLPLPFFTTVQLPVLPAVTGQIISINI